MRSRGRLAIIGAATTLLGTIASFCTVYALCRAAQAQPQPAILAAILAVGLGRRDRVTTPLEALLACLRIAFVAAVASGIGLLLHVLPPLGAVVFLAGMFLSVWLRDRGERARTIGALIALPLVAMLIVPGPTASAPGGPFVDIALVLSAGVISLAFTSAIQWLARRVGLTAFASDASAASEKPVRAPSSGMTPTMRMALQMAVALGAAFVVAFAVFPNHWGWAVLTAFIVCSGARGRGDALYKAVLRLAGALSGTIAAAVLARLWAPRGVGEAIAIFAVLFVGLALRDVNYAYWAASTTLILALLAGGSGGFDLGLLGTRIEAIVVGALCAVAATWFVYPIRTEAVIRRRLADALLALDEVLAHAHHDHAETRAKHAAFERRMHELESVAPPVRWHRRLFARGRDANHPARWIELAGTLRAHSTALATPEPLPAAHVKSIRRAIGASRRAIADHGNATIPDAVPVGTALEHVQRLFDSARRTE